MKLYWGNYHTTNLTMHGYPYMHITCSLVVDILYGTMRYPYGEFAKLKYPQCKYWFLPPSQCVCDTHCCAVPSVHACMVNITMHVLRVWERVVERCGSTKYVRHDVPPPTFATKQEVEVESDGSVDAYASWRHGWRRRIPRRGVSRRTNERSREVLG